MSGATRNARDRVETLARLTVAAPLVATTGWMTRVYDQRRGGVALVTRTPLVLYRVFTNLVRV